MKTECSISCFRLPHSHGVTFQPVIMLTPQVLTGIQAGPDSTELAPFVLMAFQGTANVRFIHNILVAITTATHVGLYLNISLSVLMKTSYFFYPPYFYSTDIHHCTAFRMWPDVICIIVHWRHRKSKATFPCNIVMDKSTAIHVYCLVISKWHIVNVLRSENSRLRDSRIAN